MDSIKVDTNVLEEEIIFLKGMLDGKDQSDITYATKGEFGDYMQLALYFYEELNNSLDTLITNTISFLENAKDGIIDVDQSGAEILERLKAEVSG